MAMLIGERSSVQFKLSWTNAAKRGTAMEVTRGSLVCILRDREAWAVGDSEDGWPLVELLEHLAACWPYLVHEPDFDPIGLGGSPLTMWQRAGDHWPDRSTTTSLKEQDTLREYLRTHDLGEGFRGVLAPSLFMFRSARADHAILSTSTVRAELPWDDTLHTLDRLGTAIAERLKQAKCRRAEVAAATWKTARKVDAKMQLAAFSGWSVDQVVEFAGGEDEHVIRAAWGSNAALSPFAWAARMIGAPRSLTALQSLFEPVRSSVPTPIPALTVLRNSLPDCKGEPFEQGYILGEWIRQVSGIGPKEMFPIDEFMGSLGIQIVDVEADGVPADAICVWQQNEVGPIVVVNSCGKHAQQTRGRRATLCHELCHLLVDIGGAELPIAEAKALGAPASLEARANAFAAEVLAPRKAVGDEFEDVLSGGETGEVDRLCRRYVASRAIVAWQAINSDRHLRDAVRSKLTRMARSLVQLSCPT